MYVSSSIILYVDTTSKNTDFCLCNNFFLQFSHSDQKP